MSCGRFGAKSTTCRLYAHASGHTATHAGGPVNLSVAWILRSGRLFRHSARGYGVLRTRALTDRAQRMDANIHRSVNPVPVTSKSQNVVSAQANSLAGNSRVLIWVTSPPPPEGRNSATGITLPKSPPVCSITGAPIPHSTFKPLNNE